MKIEELKTLVKGTSVENVVNTIIETDWKKLRKGEYWKDENYSLVFKYIYPFEEAGIYDWKFKNEKTKDIYREVCFLALEKGVYDIDMHFNRVVRNELSHAQTDIYAYLHCIECCKNEVGMGCYNEDALYRNIDGMLGYWKIFYSHEYYLKDLIDYTNECIDSFKDFYSNPVEKLKHNIRAIFYNDLLRGINHHNDEYPNDTVDYSYVLDKINEFNKNNEIDGKELKKLNEFVAKENLEENATCCLN